MSARAPHMSTLTASMGRGSCLALCALGWASACEPLDIQLFPDRVDAGLGGDRDQDATPSLPPAEAAVPPACLLGAQSCEACVTAGACAGELTCHPISGECVTPCSNAETACPGESSCNAELGVCVECIDSDTCSSDDLTRCDPRSGRCVECLTEDDCDEAEERPICLPQGICGCLTNDDCAVGSCESGECEEDDE